MTEPWHLYVKKSMHGHYLYSVDRHVWLTTPENAVAAYAKLQEGRENAKKRANPGR